MEWMPPSLTASQCAKLEMLQFKRMEGGIHEALLHKSCEGFML